MRWGKSRLRLTCFANSQLCLNDFSTLLLLNRPGTITTAMLYEAPRRTQIESTLRFVTFHDCLQSWKNTNYPKSSKHFFSLYTNHYSFVHFHSKHPLLELKTLSQKTQ